MDLGATVNREVVGNLIIYIANHCKPLYQTKLLKLLFLIDEEAVKEKGTPITWLEYNVWEKGPVAKEIYFSKVDNHNSFGDFFHYRKIVRKNKNSICYLIVPNKKVDLNEFSKSDLRIIDHVLEKYGNKTSDELIQLTHGKNTLWYKIKQENNIVFHEDNKVSNKVINFEYLIQDDNMKRMAYHISRENLQSQTV
jgi:uncharacterized phage-associated protein